MQKTLLTVEITTKAGNTISVADTVTDPKGTNVWESIIHDERILYLDGDKWTYISHDCVCSATATMTTQEVEAPEDDFCESIEDPCDEPTP